MPTQDEIKFQKLRDCFAAGYSFPQYCLDRSYKKPLIVSYTPEFLWEAYVQFRYSKSIDAEYRLLSDSRDVNYSVACVVAGRRFERISETEEWDGYDIIIVLTTNRQEYIPRDKSVYFDVFLAQIMAYVYAERPVYNFMRLNPGVRVILWRNPVIHDNGQLTENEKSLLKGSTQQAKAQLLNNKKNGFAETVRTPFDDLGYDNETALKLLTAGGATTDAKGCTQLIDNGDEIAGIADGRRRTAARVVSGGGVSRGVCHAALFRHLYHCRLRNAVGQNL
jgi:hypothetical protein